MRMLLSTLAATTVLAAATFAAAQSAPPPPPPGSAHAMGEGHGWRAHKPDPARLAAHLRTALQLRPDQDGALQAYVAALQPPAGEKPEHKWGERGEMARTPTPEKLDRMLARARERMTRLEKRAAATKTFYAALSPSQQQAFDLMAEAHMHRMGGGWGGHPPMGGAPGED